MVGGVLVTAPQAKPTLLILFLRITKLNIPRGGVAGQNITIVVLRIALAATSKPASSRAVSVIISRGRTEPLLALVVTGQKNLENNRNQEKETESR